MSRRDLIPLRIRLLAVPLLILSSSVAAEPTKTLDLKSCHLPNYRQEVLCGSHTVFEDRSAASGREIEIHFAVLPAVGETTEPDPVVLFAGGPGQAAMDLAPLARRVFAEVNKTRSLILIDQRGMGSSHPLKCEAPDEDLSMPAEALRERTREVLSACVESLDADVRLYTQDLANADIHEIVLALGYTKANLYGGSWGTRSALLYAAQFPDSVRTLVLDGALPLANTAPLYAAADADRALRMLLADCAADSACLQAFPDLEASYAQAMDLLGTGEVSMEVDNPTTGATQTLFMSRAVFGGALRNILYIPELSRVVPLIIQQASVGEYEAFLGVSGYLASAMGDGMTLGASLTIFCSEELARIEPDGPAREAAESSLLGASFLEDLENSCSVWPKAPIPTLYSQAVGSSAPALILSGAIDPITPPRWGDGIAEALPNSLHLIATNTGHNVAPVGCAADLIAQFVEQGNLDGLDGSCLEEVKRPSFFVNTSGPEVPKNDD